MRCPKCQYISFESGERCRNCGYDFSLSLDAPSLDLPIQNGSEAIGPMGDLALNDLDRATASTSDAAPIDVAPPPPSAPITASFELPLFKPPADADAPLVTPGAAPRAPLSVRRGGVAARPKPSSPTPRPVRKPHEPPRREPDTPRLALETAEMPIVPEPATAAAVDAPPAGVLAASTSARLVAAGIDLAIVAGIDAGVLYFTLKVCGLTFADVRALPIAPLAAFLLLLDGGYFTAFVAAGGQTIGKMGAGVRVIPGDPGAPPTERVSLGHAIVRAAAYLVSALPAGLGFLPALLGGEGRALHDRLADTRVVKA